MSGVSATRQAKDEARHVVALDGLQDADGVTRFLVVQDSGRPPIKVTEMILVQNWVEELKRRVPAK
jgi:hypothetical protein